MNSDRGSSANSIRKSIIFDFGGIISVGRAGGRLKGGFRDFRGLTN